MPAVRIQGFLLVETIIFVTAALIHFEVLFDGYDDVGAGTAESILALVLLGGLGLSLARATKDAALTAQLVALLGTFIGLFLFIFVGPRTVLDLSIHIVMVLVLVTGLVTAWRTPDAIFRKDP